VIDDVSVETHLEALKTMSKGLRDKAQALSVLVAQLNSDADQIDRTVRMFTGIEDEYRAHEREYDEIVDSKRIAEEKLGASEHTNQVIIELLRLGWGNYHILPSEQMEFEHLIMGTGALYHIDGERH
jgi:hypothetical protein